MNYVVNAVLLLTVSAQLACTGSDNLPPVFSGESDFKVAEGQQLNVDLKFIDPEGESIRLSVSGGQDQRHFAWSSANQLIFVQFPDFEFPADADTDNRYELTIAASDGTNQTLQPISIEVTNVRSTVAVNNSQLFITDDGFFNNDQNEPLSASFSGNGSFSLDGLTNNSIVVSVGGSDKISGIDLGNIVLAGFARTDDDFNITPLSTMLVNLGLSDATVEQQFLTALGLGNQLSTNDIVALDPWGLVQGGDSSADSLLRLNQQLLNLMVTLGNLTPEDSIQGAVDSNRALASALLAYSQENTGQAINLGNAAVITDIFAEAADELGLAIAQDQQAIAAVASSLAQLNTALQNQAINPTGADAAAILSATQVDLQDAVRQLTAIDEGISIAQFEDLTSPYQLFDGLSDNPFIALDSDTYNTGTGSSGNNTLATAQPIANPVTLSGYVNTAGEGEAGASLTSGDEDDIFQIEALGGEVINLVMPASYPADLDLYLYDSAQNLIDYSIGDSRFESIQLPASAGTYYIDVRTHDTGASTYDLTIGHNQPLSTTALSAAQSTFVIGHLIVQQASDEPDISDLLDGFVASQQWRSASGVTSLYTNANMLGDASSGLANQASTLRMVKTITNDSRVIYAEPNFIRQHMANPFTDQWHSNGLNSPVALSAAVNTVASENNNVTVAVIDTGIWQSHPDLQIAITEQYDFISDASNAGDGDGIDEAATDPGDGRDNNQCPNSSSATSSFHGTQIAGVIGGYDQGASTNSLPITLMNLRALGCYGGYDFDVANAIRYAAGLENSANKIIEPADIINLSLGAAGYSTTLQQAIAQARHNDVIIIAAAGNEASADAYYPAAYDDVIAVSATNAQEDLASYSNFGSAIDISAPGGDDQATLSAVINNAEILADTKMYQGTSIAAAHISGVAALMKSAHADLTPYDLDTLIISGEISHDFGSSGRDDDFGYGLIDEASALDWATRLANGEPLPTITGRVISNPIAGSDVFIDADKDFIQDEGETATTSNKDGFFTLDIVDEDGLEDNSIIVSVGGTDTVTGIALDNLVLAGFAQEDELFAITPITTLLATADTEDIEALLNGFGLAGSPSLGDIASIDPWDWFENGDQDQVDTADDLLRTNQQLLNLMLTLGSLTTDSDEDSGIANNQALAATLLSYIQGNASENIDLGNTATLSAIINNVAADLALDIATDAQAIAAVASSLASLNTLLRDASIDPTDQIAAAAITAAQSDLQEAIQQLSSGAIGTEQFNNNTAVSTLFDDHPAFTDLPDTDIDGIVDLVDDDDDGDDIADRDDAFPKDASETTDSDGDGAGDNSDAFPNNESETIDSDGDGTGDNTDADTEASRVGLQDSQIFIDNNGNFTQDDNETSTTSNNNGFFILESVNDNSVIVAVGGTDIITDNALDNLVLAGFGQDNETVAITPISTLMVSLQSGDSEDTQAILTALGFDESLSTDAVATTDPLTSAQQAEEGDSATADNLLRTNQQLLNLMLTLDSMIINGNADSASAINDALASKLISYIQNNNGESIDLGSAVDLSAIIEDVTTELGITADPQAVAAVASSLASLNALLGDDSIDPTDEAATAIISGAQVALQNAVQQLSAGTITAEVFNNKTSVATLFRDDPAFAELADSDGDGLADLIAETEQQIKQKAAVAAIETYADNGSDNPPSVDVYTAAGVAGVTEANLNKVNKAITEADTTGVLTKERINQIAAEAIIKNHAEDGSDNGPSVDVYTAAGIAGVTETNLEKVNAAIARVSNPDGLTEQQIKKIAAVAIIEAYADGSSEDAPSRQNYLDAGFDSIKTDVDVAAINAVIAGTASDTVGQEADGALSEDQINQLVGLAMIKAYTADALLTDLTPDDYAAVEINHVTQANIEEVNAAIANTDIDEIATVAGQAVIQADALAIIEAYADSGGDGSQQVPSVSDYTAAGIDDVTDTNLNNVNTAIVAAESDDALTKEQINQIAADAVRQAYEADASRVGLQGSQIFIDSNENFTQDDNEATTATTSNENGFFTLDSVDENSVIVAVGGTDIISGNELGDLLLAGFGREDEPFSVTPISTLLVNLESDDPEDSTGLLAALGLDSGTSIDDIVTTDPFIEDQDGSATTDDLLRTNQQLLNLMLTASSLTGDDNGTEEGSAIDTNAALAETLLGYAETNESIDLADTEVLKAIITDIVDADGLSIEPDIIAAIASRLATLNFIIDETIDPTDSVAIAAIGAAQDELQGAIQQLSPDSTVDQFVNDTEIATLFGDLASLGDLLDSDNDDLPDVIDDNDDNDDMPDRDELFDTDSSRQGNISGINGSASLATGPKEHQTLEVVVKNADNYSGKLLYQWYRVDSNLHAEPIVGAATKIHTLIESDVGSRIKVRVTYNDESDDINNGDFVESPLSGKVVANNPPIATPKSIDVEEQRPTAFSLNGTDPDGTTLTTFQIRSLPNDGTLTHDGVVLESTSLPYVVGDSLLYQSVLDNPTPSTSFTFKAFDGHLYSEEATLTINIKPVNDKPTSDTVTLSAIAEDSDSYSITASALLAKAADVESDDLTVSHLEISSGLGELTDNNDNSWVYTPQSNDDSAVSFSYMITDDGKTAGADDFQSISGTAELDITSVNDAPTSDTVTLSAIAEDSDSYSITESALLAKTDDVESDDLTVSHLEISGGLGELTDNNDNSWEYTPQSNDDSAVSFSYMITDDGKTAGADDFQSIVGTAELEITPVNDRPSIYSEPQITVNESELYEYEIVSDDVDGDSLVLTVTIDDQPFTGSGKFDEWLDITVNQVGSENGYGKLKGTPDNSHVGNYDVVITVDDNSGSPDNSTYTQTFTISVLNVNTNIDLATMTSDVGLRIDGVSADDNSGWSVSHAGDVDGDGVSDVIIGIGKPLGDKAYLVYGADSTDNDPIDLKDGAPKRFKTLSNVGGKVVSAAGDFNGDGYDDVIIGERTGTPTDIDDTSRGHAGISHVRFGGPRDITSTNMSIYGATQDSNIGASVSGAGDINGDGYADIIVGGSDRNNISGAYIIYGGKITRDIDLANFNSSLGFSIDGVPADGQDQDYRVSSAGDVDGDGYDDVLITGNKSKSIYILYGGVSDKDNIDFTSNNPLEFGEIKVGNDDGVLSNVSVSGAGDIDGDGYDDLIIGVPYENQNRGITYVLYGSDSRFIGNQLDITNLEHFEITGADEQDTSGFSVSSAGDIDGDGFDDLVIGAFMANTSYVLYGRIRDNTDINLSEIAEGTDYSKGFAISDSRVNPTQNGFTVSGAGDVNDDGFEDVIIGAPNADVVVVDNVTRSEAGSSYIIYGGPREHDRVADGTNIPQSFGYTMIGHRSDDQLSDSASDSVLIGGAGDDTLTIDNEDFNRIDGGSGTDTLIFNTGMNLDFTGNDEEQSTTTVKKTAIKDIEVFDLGSYESTLILAPTDVLNLSTTTNTLTVKGHTTNTLKLFNSPTDGTDWVEDSDSGDWEDSGSEAVVAFEGNAPNVEQVYEQTVTFTASDFPTIVINHDASPPNVTFNASPTEEDSDNYKNKTPHHLALNDAVDVLDKLEELTIKMEFELDFARDDNTEHAYLFSLANDAQDNMLSIFLKDRDDDDKWDLSVWVEDDEQNDNDKRDQKLFVHVDWIEQYKEVVLWVAINLNSNNDNVSVYANIDNGGLAKVDNECDSINDIKLCYGSTNNVTSFIVEQEGAVFGNDQDLVGDKFSHKQAFEGEFYGLKIYDKSIDPTANDIPEGVSLIYSLSPGSIASN